MNSRISVIIPSFNAGRYIRFAIDSVLKQTYKDYEIIVIDDGSTDNTPEMVRTYIATDQIKYFYQENAGLSAARNSGISRSTGEFIALLDADDEWNAEKLSYQVNMMNSSQYIGMVFTDFNTFNDETILAKNKIGFKFEEHSQITFLELFRGLNFIHPSTVLIRKTVFSRCGYFDTELRAVEDYDMWLRISKEFRIIGIKKPLTNIRLHGGNMSKNIENMLRSELKALSKYKEEVEKPAFFRRKAKVFMINADRAVCGSDYKNAIRYLIQGFFIYPFLLNDIVIVLIKLILGDKLIQKLGGMIEFNGWLRAIYHFFYKRY